jgi:hypothetical protein
VAILNPTPADRLLDGAGRPYFLWDCEMSLAEFVGRLASEDVEDRAYWLGKLMRQAKPDDVFTFVRPERIAEDWPHLQRYLGHTRPFWDWLLRTWKLVP